ncbi:nuclear transport factor 2 family protein [Mycobacterium sp. CSUR Q5927]|nr:nuclear transport factor 2 family protein [Mycobacterium sp. CSUR Q5927]
MTNKTVLREALRNYAEAKNRHDVDAIVAAYAPDGSYQDSGVRRPVTGRAQLRTFYAAFFESVPDYQGRFDGTAFGDDTAVVWGRMTGTVGDDLLGLATNSGSRIDVPVTFVCTFRGGQLISDCGYFDTRLLHHQVGLARAAKP